MKLGSLRAGGRDGTLIVLSTDLNRAVAVDDIAATMQDAIERWDGVKDQLAEVYDSLNSGAVDSEFSVDSDDLASPFPRGVQFLDGSVYLGHMRRARGARGADMPPNWETEPLMYQGVADHFMGPTEDCVLPDEDLGVDYEAEIAVVVDDVPMGVSAEDAGRHVVGVMLLNDWTLRNLTRIELPKQFGFMQAKPSSAFSPAFVTVDELQSNWDGATFSGRIRSGVNGSLLGEPDAGKDMYFTYSQLIAHAARTRRLTAGTIVGAGTISNDDHDGANCVAELRVHEQLEHGEATTPFLVDGDTVFIEMLDDDGNSIFGRIEQRVRLV